ncbi:hypothetical protein LCGC14_2407820 [marine sediment metagenome]|uniref:Uncharacterized protein n=1 Tax=marine sediment metagenome TaxID=412755 RepID=A0A0F9E5J2_9ZZZZ
MKLFGIIVGCSEALFHCEHEEETKERVVETPVSAGCNRTYMKSVHEIFSKCCKCSWAAWVKDPTTYYTLT